jgi:hypothetical protein
LVFDLAAEIEQLKQEEVWRRNARNGKTLVKEGGLRVTLTALKANATMPDEHVDGRMTVQVLQGSISLRVGDLAAEGPGPPPAAMTDRLRAGQVAAIDSAIPWDITADEESVLLLTIAWGDRQH